MGHVYETNAAVQVFLLLLRKPSHLQLIRACCSLFVVEQMKFSVVLPEASRVILKRLLLQRLLYCLLLLVSLVLCFLGLCGFLFLLFLTFIWRQDLGLDQLIPVLPRDGIRFLLQQGQTVILRPDFEVPVDQLEELSLVLNVQLVVFAKAVHSLERQSHQELARLLVLDDLFDVELNYGLASLENWVTFEL